MPFVEAKCTNCNAVLPVDNTKDAWVCGYCGTTFIVEKAINNYNIQNASINADNINIFASEKDFIIRGGVLEKYVGEATEVVIPNNVVIIGKEAFCNCRGITSVTIPSSVKKIEDGDYRDKVAYGPFFGCSSLNQVNISDSVTYIGGSAFGGCSSLMQINIPDGIPFIGGYAFYGCSSLMQINIPDGIPFIGGYAFYGCSSLTHIDIPNSVTSIGAYAFSGSVLTHIDIPNSVTHIGVGAFENCNNLRQINDIRMNGNIIENYHKLFLLHKAYNIPRMSCWGAIGSELVERARNKQCLLCGKGSFLLDGRLSSHLTCGVCGNQKSYYRDKYNAIIYAPTGTMIR